MMAAASPVRLTDTSSSSAAMVRSSRDLAAKHLSPPEPTRALSLGIATFDEAMPDGGLPSGAVVELCAPDGLGRATHLALCACAAAQRESRQLREASDWTAWIDASDPAQGSLFGPALVRTGIDLTRLLVVRPNPEDVARVAVRLAASRLFRVIVVDRSGLPGAAFSSRARWSTVVRRLALTAESSDATILLLSSTSLAQRERLPTAMRIELSQRERDQLVLHITKDRRGRLPGPVSIPITTLSSAVNGHAA